MPVLAASTPESETTDAIWARTSSGDTPSEACTPRLFWAVTAVMAATPHTPWASNVLRSASTPAPPLESDPAMVSATGRLTVLKPVLPAAGVDWQCLAGERALSRVGGADPDAERNRQVGDRRGEDQLVVLSAGQRLVEGGARCDRHLVEGEAHARLVGDVAEVGDKTVGNVDHRRRARAPGVDTLGHPGDRSTRPAARGRRTEGPGDEERLARTGARPRHRRAVDRAGHGDGDN